MLIASSLVWAAGLAIKISELDQATIDSDPYKLGYDLRTSASLTHSLWRQVAQETSKIHNLLAIVQRKASDLEDILIQVERRRNQLRYQCRDTEPISFTDLGGASSFTDLKADFRIVDPLNSEVQSSWSRGPPLQSRTAGSRTIEQKTVWPTETPLQSTALLVRQSQYTVGQILTQVGIRPTSRDRMAAGLTIGYIDPSSFYFAYLDLQGSDCAVRFGRVTNGSCHFIKNMTCGSHDVRYGAYRTLTFVSEPLTFRFYLDSEPVGAVDLTQADYREGSAGVLSVTGSANFAGLSIGPPKISTKIAYSANTPSVDWREKILELYDLTSSKTADSDEGRSSSSGNLTNLERTAYHCSTYKPTHVLPEDLICSDANYWRFENTVNGTLISSVKDLKASDSLEQCVVGDWSCRDSEVSLRLTFNSDGEAGVVLRSHNDTLFTMVTLETVSQKVTLSEMLPNSGVSPIWQMVSSVPIVAHETNSLIVRDLNGKISVTINNDSSKPLFETWATNKAEGLPADKGGVKRIAYAAGFIVRRGNVKFENLSFRGL